MRVLAVFLVVLNLVLASLLLTYIACFCNLGGEKALPFWAAYPSLPPHLAAVVSGSAFLLMAAITVSGYGFLHLCLKRSYLVVSVFCLLSGIVPYAGGHVLLFRALGGNVEEIGRWLAVSLLGPLYAIIFSLFFAGLYFWRTSGYLPFGRNLPEEGNFASLSAR